MHFKERPQPGIPALWPIIGIPLMAIIASVLLVWQATDSADPELPAHYFTEGRALDDDIARGQRALQLGLAIDLVFERGGEVVADISPPADAGYLLPAALDLRLTHATLPTRDRQLTLQRSPDGRYRGRMATLEGGPWLVQLADGDTWRLRARLEGSDGGLRLGVDAR
jgi:hypothetical protein